METFVILHNIRSAHNVGSVFRSADGAGVSKIFLSGYTPTPLDRFGRERDELRKTSLGATHTVPYEVVDDIHSLLQTCTKQGVQIVAVEQTPQAIAYKTFVPTTDVAYIFGNEVTGIESDILECVGTHIHIPMSGTKESLNVSVCVGVVLFHYRVGV